MNDQLQPGTRIELIEMPDDPYPVPPGTQGTIIEHTHVGTYYEQIHVKWDIPRTLRLIPRVDKWKVIGG